MMSSCEDVTAYVQLSANLRMDSHSNILDGDTETFHEMCFSALSEIQTSKIEQRETAFFNLIMLFRYQITIIF